jgi:DNA invertase Pin-like site-specific DNA recombinase
MGSGRYISYLPVSADKQGKAGLGIKAQRDLVSRHLNGGHPTQEFVDVESGKRTDRPQLAAALAACRAHGATLIIAKLDRLARNLHFISGLMESGVDFIAADNPHANRLTIHILSAVAEEEARMISLRTKDALAVAKARGVKLDNPNGRVGIQGQADWQRGRACSGEGSGCAAGGGHCGGDRADHVANRGDE